MSADAPGGGEDPTADPRHREVPGDPRAERLVAGLLFGAAAFGLAFCGLFVFYDDTQLLGLSIGLSLALLATATIVAGKRLVPQETAVEERPALVHEPKEAEVEEIVRGAGEGVSRRRLLISAGGAAGATLGVAVVLPVASLGPLTDSATAATPWRRGRRLVDDRGRPVLAEDVELGSFVTAFPDGAPRNEFGSPVVLVRVPPAELDLPRGREGWAPEGILAFSKICTHVGCAISLYRYPTYEPTSEPPALVCPCHYSTFDVRRGAEVVFGPAGRPLPQLPLSIDAERRLVASGDFSGKVGPSYLGVRRP